MFGLTAENQSFVPNSPLKTLFWPAKPNRLFGPIDFYGLLGSNLCVSALRPNIGFGLVTLGIVKTE